MPFAPAKVYLSRRKSGQRNHAKRGFLSAKRTIPHGAFPKSAADRKYCGCAKIDDFDPKQTGGQDLLRPAFQFVPHGHKCSPALPDRNLWRGAPWAAEG